MLDNRMNIFENAHLLGQQCPENIYVRQYNTALNRFRAALFQGKLLRLKRKLLNRRQDLYDLNASKSDLHMRGSFYSGIKVVRIDSIIGSEGRAADFDADFHPLDEATRARWVSMAIAYVSRIPLPPIQLIQIGDAYFVRDGHHRISVAKAFGQIAMDAEVITWNADSPFPWQSNVVQANLCCPDLSA